MTLNYQSTAETGRLLYPVKINYQLTLSMMIVLGKYQKVDSDITAEHFSITKSGEMEENLVIFPFEKRISTVEIVTIMGSENYEPAAIEHILAFGAKYPEVQKQFPISALGSRWRVSINLFMVPTLDVSSCNWRSLKLDFSSFTWDEGRGFLAMPKRQLV